MSANILLLLYIYLLLSYIGIGAFSLLTPDVFKKPYLYALAAPGFGFCLLAIVGSWVIAADMAIMWTTILSLIVATGLNLFALWRAGIRDRVSFNKLKTARHALPRAVVNAILLLGVLFLITVPGTKDGRFTTRLRMGPDAMGYAGAAQALVDGATLSSIAEELKALTGRDDLEEAKQVNNQLLRFDLNCSSEFLLKSLRWGYPIILANMTWATGLDSVYRLDFVLLVFSWAMLFGLAYYAARSIIKARWYVCSLLAAALALNCNLLNIYCEGSYAQMMATPILFMLLLCLYDLRKNFTLESKSGLTKRVAFVGFLCASLVSIWNELLAPLAVVCLTILILDLLLVRKTQKGWLIVLGLGALSASILIAPLTWNLILFYRRYLFTLLLPSLNQAGWWQPQWATLPEIMGWINIYAHGSQAALRPRDTVEVVAVFLGSLSIIAAAGYYLVSNRRVDRSFWLAPFIFIGLILGKTYLLDRIHNYQYYKAYTAFLPILFVFIYSAFLHVANTVHTRLRYVLWGLIVLSICMTAFGGVSYQKRYCEESSYFTEDMFDFQKHSELLSNYVLMAPFEGHVWQRAQMASTAEINRYDSGTYVEPYLDMPVAIILFDDDPALVSDDNYDVIYSCKEFQILKTPYKLSDGLDEHGNFDPSTFFDFGGSSP